MWSCVGLVLLAGNIMVAPILAAPRAGAFGQTSRFGSDMEINRKPGRSFDILKLGGPYGISKRFQQWSLSEKQRRRPPTSLTPGGTFGRIARNEFSTNRKIENLLQILLKDKLFPFDRLEKDNLDEPKAFQLIRENAPNSLEYSLSE